MFQYYVMLNEPAANYGIMKIWVGTKGRKIKPSDLVLGICSCYC